jgi:hypothetical protein
LEQVHVRGIFCRGLRLELVAGLGIALATPALAVAAQSAQALATQTTLSAETRDQGGRTQATLAVAVTGADGLPAVGAVVIKDQGRQLAGVALNAEGKAKVVLDLAGGDHLLRAAYTGDAAHQASVSQAAGVHATSNGGTPDFQVSVSPATISLTPGQSGTVTVSVTPENASALTAPMFVTLSCSGFPDQSSCSFTPENVEIQVGATAPITSSMVLTTQAASATAVVPPVGRSTSSIAWAILFPGALGLAGLAWGGRRRRWLSRLSLVALVTLLGTTACNPRYNYFNHGPPTNPATPAGTYNLLVTAQSSNGVTAITHSTTLVFTVK